MEYEEESLDRPTIRLRRVRREGAEREGYAVDARVESDGGDVTSAADSVYRWRDGGF